MCPRPSLARVTRSGALLSAFTVLTSKEYNTCTSGLGKYVCYTCSTRDMRMRIRSAVAFGRIQGWGCQSLSSSLPGHFEYEAPLSVIPPTKSAVVSQGERCSIMGFSSAMESIIGVHYRMVSPYEWTRMNRFVLAFWSFPYPAASTSIPQVRQNLDVEIFQRGRRRPAGECIAGRRADHSRPRRHAAQRRNAMQRAAIMLKVALQVEAIGLNLHTLLPVPHPWRLPRDRRHLSQATGCSSSRRCPPVQSKLGEA